MEENGEEVASSAAYISTDGSYTETVPVPSPGTLEASSQGSSSDTQPRRQAAWTDEETRVFIQAWGDEAVQRALASNYRTVAQFQWIADEMRARGYDRHWEQCRQRAKVLRRGFKEIVDGNRHTGHGRRTWPYYEELSHFLCIKLNRVVPRLSGNDARPPVDHPCREAREAQDASYEPLLSAGKGVKGAVEEPDGGCRLLPESAGSQPSEPDTDNPLASPAANTDISMAGSVGPSIPTDPLPPNSSIAECSEVSHVHPGKPICVTSRRSSRKPTFTEKLLEGENDGERVELQKSNHEKPRRRSEEVTGDKFLLFCRPGDASESHQKVENPPKKPPRKRAPKAIPLAGGYEDLTLAPAKKEPDGDEVPVKVIICDDMFSPGWDGAGMKIHKCSVCGKCFSLRSRLIVHERTHTGEKPYTCPECGRSFSVNSSLIAHRRTHMEEKPYKCTLCPKSFSVKSGLVTHERTHTGEKPYKCSYCTKSFRRNSGLVSHQRIHTGDKPYQCSVCEKSFSDISNLITHQRIHTGEKPYKCSDCGRSFAQSSNLVSHQRIHAEGRT